MTERFIPQPQPDPVSSIVVSPVCFREPSTALFFYPVLRAERSDVFVVTQSKRHLTSDIWNMTND